MHHGMDDLEVDDMHDEEYMDDDDDDDDAPEYGGADLLEGMEIEEEDDDDEDDGEGGGLELPDDAVEAMNTLVAAGQGDRPFAAMATADGSTVQFSIRDLLRLLSADAPVPARPRPPVSNRPVLTLGPATEPDARGEALLLGGEFGRIAPKAARTSPEGHLSRVLRQRGARSRPTCREDMLSHIVPNTNGVAVAMYDASAYAGQFSTDSSFYYTCCQDWQLHVYDMTVAHKPWEPKSRRNMATDHQTTMTVIKDIEAVPGRWTITDSHLSPDNQKIIYASMSSTVHMTNTLDSSPEQIPLSFADPRGTAAMFGERDGIWSCRFSADGNEVVAGGNTKIYVYDLLANRRTVKISAHEDDVNSCCWADTASGNVLISASDDTFLKVWDRRSLGGAQKPAGVLVGHTEGITSVSAKGDGRYVVSNGKDQAARLWDLRAMCGSAEFDTFRYPRFGDPDFDYRYGSPPTQRYAAHPKDCSVMTFRGHSVLQTLIRCWFSPAETTGGRYIYSGSADGRIHIWSLDGRIVQVLDRAETLPMAYDPCEPEPPRRAPGGARTVCVRDVSWHAQQPVLLSVGWANRRSGSVVARHEWKGLGKLGGRLEDWVDKQGAEYAERARRTPAAAATRVPGAFDSGDEDAWTDEEE